ncbi:MAG: FadR family transcriptional regulator [Betaproteobacteria bacterium]|nr:MAG: FadR family transcriptional regulator [Betaproteobacteria bacterium]
MAQRLRDEIYEVLMQQIVSGEYSVGGRLPGEFALARSVGVSRPVLRQALARLRSDGLIRSRRGAGNFVIRREARSTLEFGPLQSIPDVHRCLEFRAALETAAARHAAALQDSAGLGEIGRSMEAMEKAVANGGPSVEPDFEFHLAIARATRNRFFVITLEALRAPVLFGIDLTRSLSKKPASQRLEDVCAEHRRIHEAIRDADAEAAGMAMARHVQAGISRLFNE